MDTNENKANLDLLHNGHYGGWNDVPRAETARSADFAGKVE
jgi:hypothetical protein